jgi:3-oxoadipate CoA-transferase, alpha subunit
MADGQREFLHGVRAIRSSSTSSTGIGGLYTPTGVGTLLAEGKEQRTLDGRQYMLEHPIKADVALIRAHQADRVRNLVYGKTGRNFVPIMATAAALPIAEASGVVPIGGIDPETLITRASSSIVSWWPIRLSERCRHDR